MATLAETLQALDDIPGTTIFTAARVRKGFQLNHCCMSLMNPANRDRFRADERAYLQEWKLPVAQQDAVIARDYNALIAEGGNIYFLVKLANTDGISVMQAVSTMTGLAVDDYAAMMNGGGRSPEGQRSKLANAAGAGA